MWDTKEQSVRVLICHHERLKMLEMGFYYRVYTPLYKKGIKQNQNKPMETTI